jgi:crotonobetainyl-CoA:carnitine CoA-transferase CaiB-like acyl-CoA transferase
LARTGNQAEMNAPRGLYRTRDDAWLAVSASTAAPAARVMRLVGSPATATAEWFGSAGVPVDPVLSAADIFADPQYEAIGSIGTYEHERLGPVRMPTPLFRLSATPGRVDRLGAELGELTEEVLGAIGLSPTVVAELRARRIV